MPSSPISQEILELWQFGHGLGLPDPDLPSQCPHRVINVAVGQGGPAIHVRRAPKADITRTL